VRPRKQSGRAEVEWSPNAMNDRSSMILHIPLLKTGRTLPEQSSDTSRESWSHHRALMEDEGSDRAPLRKWVVDETAAPQCFDSWRMNQIPEERREEAWLQRRRHYSCGLLVPISLAMDSTYYRFDGEKPYGYVLSRLRTESPEVPLDGLGLQFICRSRPYVPFSWPSVRASGPKAQSPRHLEVSSQYLGTTILETAPTPLFGQACWPVTETRLDSWRHTGGRRVIGEKEYCYPGRRSNTTSSQQYQRINCTRKYPRGS
jgi:hypothetical protein